MSTTTYILEHAKSARSKCSKCKTKIEKGELRIFYKNDDGSKVFSSSTKLECFKLPRKFKHLSMEEFVDEILIDGTEDSILEDPSERKTIMDKLNMVPEKKKKKKMEEEEEEDANDGESTSLVQSAKRCAALMTNDDNEGDNKPATKKFKLSDEDKTMGEAYMKFKPMKNAELQDILAWNNVVKTGTKDVLLTRVMDGYLHGRIAKCFVCGKGQPKISDDGSHVICTGFFDSASVIPIPCGTKSKPKDVKRLPWFHQEPTKEEKEAMEKEGDDEDDSDDKIPQAMMKAVKKLDWDLSTKDSKKKAARDMFELCCSDTSPLDFPTDTKKAKFEIGNIVIQNKDKDASGIFELIVEKYGMKEKNKANAEKKSSRIASIVEVAGNAEIFQVLSELSSLYYKGGNVNAGNTYKKVSQAVKELDFLITEDNAKGLGKGKTKVTGIGKGSAEKIYEFVTTGTIQKLEEKRAEVE